jgi:signal transduction histidine kinase
VARAGDDAAAEPAPRASVAAALHEEVRAFERAAERAGKQLRFVDDGRADGSVADVRVLRQLVSILIDNGIRYGDPGSLTVQLGAEGGAVVVRVADQGPGLTAHRAAGSRSADSSGLGIALASALALRAGGRMELEMDGDTGTVWAIRIPRLRPEPRRPTSAQGAVS